MNSNFVLVAQKQTLEGANYTFHGGGEHQFNALWIGRTKGNIEN